MLHSDITVIIENLKDDGFLKKPPSYSFLTLACSHSFHFLSSFTNPRHSNNSPHPSYSLPLSFFFSPLPPSNQIFQSILFLSDVISEWIYFKIKEIMVF